MKDWWTFWKALTLILIFILIVCIIIWYWPLIKANADWDYPQIIKCLNYTTGEIKEPLDQTKQGCYVWQWFTTVRLPTQYQMDMLNKFYNKEQIINRLAIINHESQFDVWAKWWQDYWLLQIHWWVEFWGKTEEQFAWLKNRDKYTLKICWKYWIENNTFDWYKKWEDAVISCYYRLHNNANLKWYSKKLMKLREIYTNYFYPAITKKK